MFCAIRAIARTCAKAHPQWYATGRRAKGHLNAAYKAYRRKRLPQDLFYRLKAAVTTSGDGGDAVPLPPEWPGNRLFRRPNPYMSRAQWLYQYAQQVCATGSAMCWVRRNQYREFDVRGVPVRMYVIPTGLCVPQVPSADYRYGSYRVMPVGSFQTSPNDPDGFGDGAWTSLMLTGGTIDGREVRPVRWPHPLYLTDGLSAIQAGQLWVDIANMLDRATFYGLKHTTRPSYIFQYAEDAEQPDEAEEERLLRQMAAYVQGVQNTGRSAIMPPGLSIADASRGVAELDYVAGRPAIGQDVLALFSTPPVACGVQQAGAYAAYIASLVQFSDQAVEPILQLLAEDMEHELGEAYGGDCELRVPAPPINDKDHKEQVLAASVSAQTMTVNQYRKERGWEPMPWPVGEMICGNPMIADQVMRELGLDLRPLVPQAVEGSAVPGAHGGHEGFNGPGQGGGGAGKSPAHKGKPKKGKTETGRATGTGRASKTGPAARKKAFPATAARFAVPGLMVGVGQLASSFLNSKR